MLQYVHPSYLNKSKNLCPKGQVLYLLDLENFTRQSLVEY